MAEIHITGFSIAPLKGSASLALYMLNDGIFMRIVAMLLLMSAGMHADTVLLKTGELKKGKIIKETDDEITILVFVTPSIRDDLVIKKNDVKSFEKVPPDEEAWMSLASLSLGQESLDAEDYDSVIATLGNFIERFPESLHVSDAKQKIERFQEELKRVDAGELKVDGQWLDRAKVLEERIQIGGRILLNRMRRFASSNQGIEAMQVFELLEKNFGGSASYPDAVVVARQVLPSLVRAVEERKFQLKRRAERDKQRLQTAKGAEREQLEAIFKAEQQSMEAYASASDKGGTKWLPLQYATDKNITTVAQKISSEQTRVIGLPLEKMRLSLIGAQTAATALANRDLAGAEKALTDAKSAWGNNELVLRVGAQIADAKKAEAAAKAAKAAAARATPVPPPKRTP